MSTPKIDQILDELELKRIKAHKKAKRVFPRAFIRVYVVFVAFILTVIFLIEQFGDPEKTNDSGYGPVVIGVIVAGIFVGSMLAGIYTLLRRGKMWIDFWNDAKTSLMGDLVQEINPSFTYKPEGINIAEFTRADLFGGGIFESEDQVTASVNGSTVSFAECRISQSDSTSTAAGFLGFMVTCPYDMKGVQGPVQYIPVGLMKILPMMASQKSRSSSKKELKEVRDPFVTLSNSFEVYMPEPDEIGNLITEDVLETLDSLSKYFKGRTLHLTFSFNEDHFHMACTWHLNLFRGNLFLKTPLKKSNFINSFKKDLTMINDVIEIMKPIVK